MQYKSNRNNVKNNLFSYRIALERAFTQNPKPSSEEVYYISESLNMEKVKIKVIFEITKTDGL